MFDDGSETKITNRKRKYNMKKKNDLFETKAQKNQSVNLSRKSRK